MAEARLIDLPLSEALRRFDRAAQKDFAAEGFEEKLAASYGRILQSFADRAQELERKAAIADALDEAPGLPLSQALSEMASGFEELRESLVALAPNKGFEGYGDVSEALSMLAQKAKGLELESHVREREIHSLRTQLMAMDSALLARQSCEEIEQRLTDLKALEGGAAIVDLREHFARETRFNSVKREGAGHDGAA
jgi:hypothetical protein